jgi:hypothetical protein
MNERDWDRADGHNEEQIKRASEKMRWLFHFADPPVSKHLLLQARQDVETFRC